MENLLTEVYYKTSHSSGSGGQHVNKVETRVSLYFHVSASALLTEEQKELLLKRLKNRINKAGMLILHCDTERSQLGNRKKVQERFLKLIESSLQKQKVRKKSKPSKKVNEERLQKKKMLSEKKQQRRIDPPLS